jgi:BlaR1 peptidase M56
MFFCSNLLTALGHSLLDSIWEMALSWSFYCLISGRNKHFSAAVRHDLMLTLCLVNIFWFLDDFLSSLNEPVSPLFSGFIDSETSFKWLSFVSVLYLLVLFCRIFNAGFHIRKQQKIKLNPGNFIPGNWEDFATRQALLLGITKKIRLYFSENVESAETSGFLKPLILMPVSLITNLSPEQLEAIIIHELLHIRRNDFLINLMMNGYRHIFFFNPFASLFYHALCHQRELACDDGVVNRNISPKIYADALFRLEKYRRIPVVYSLAADGHKPWLLHERIARLLGKPVRIHSGLNLVSYLCVLIALVLLSLSTPPSPVFRRKSFALETVATMPQKIKFTDHSFPITKIFIQQKRGHSVYKKKIAEKQIKQEINILNSNAGLESPDLMQYIDRREAVNFSNEQNTITTGFAQKSSILTPHIPERSFEFNPEIVKDQSDSLIQVRIKGVIAFTIIQKSIIKNQLKTAQNKIDIQLKNVEERRKVYQQFNEKNFEQLINKLQDQIEQKKIEINRIKIQTQALDEEIIHI